MPRLEVSAPVPGSFEWALMVMAKGMWVSNPGLHPRHIQQAGMESFSTPILVINGGSTMMPWSPTQEDIFALDWKVVR